MEVSRNIKKRGHSHPSNFNEVRVTPSKKKKSKTCNHTVETSDIDPNPFLCISKSDHDATLALLKTIDWTLAKNSSRRNVIREDDKATPRNENGKPYCMSFIFGRNMKDPNGSLSFWSTKYPQIYKELQSLMHKYDPSFKYTHITLNYNLRCKRHTDGGNAGPSYIAAFGAFQGGELIVGNEFDQKIGHPLVQTNRDKYLDLKSKFVKFNGKTQPHETAPFTGDRYTLVYYTSDIIPPVLDRRVSSTTIKPQEKQGLNPDSMFAKKFEAMKAKLSNRKR